MAQGSSLVGARVSVKADTKQVTKYLNDIQKKIVPKATATALNSSRKKTSTQIVKTVAAFFSLKQKMIRKKLVGFDLAKPRRLRAAITARWHAVPFIRIGRAVETRTGVRVKGQNIDNAFIEVMRSGHHHIMRRKDAPRLPIIEPKIQLHEDANRLAISVVKGKARGFFLMELNRQLARKLRR